MPCAMRAGNQILNITTKVLKKESVQIALLLVGLLCIFFRNIVFSDSTFMTATFVPGTMPDGPYGYSGYRVRDVPARDPGATGWQFEPWDKLISRIYHSGQLPLWNPHQAAGTPLLANMQSAPFFPLNAPIYLVPPEYWPYARDLCLLLQLFVAGFFTFLFARSVGVNRIGALGAASAFMFCGYLMFYLGMPHLHAEILIPALLYSFEKVFSRRSLSSILFAASVVCFSILGGMPEAFFFSFLFAGLYYIYRMLEEMKDRGFHLPFVVASLGRVAGAAVLGILLASFSLVPFIEFLPLSHHIHTPGRGVGLAYYPPATAISILVPYFLGGAHSGWHPPHYTTMHTVAYVGILPLALGLLALQRHREAPRLSYFFAGFSLFFLLKAYGAPLVNWVGLLPGFNVSEFRKYCAPEFAFSVAMLAGLGLDRVYHGKASLRRALIVGGLLVTVIGRFVLYYRQAMIEYGRVEYVHHHVGIALVFILLFCVLFSLSHFMNAITSSHRFQEWRRKTVAHVRPPPGSTQVSAALLGLLLIELFVYLPKECAQRYDPFIPPPYVGFLQKDPQKHRVLGLDLVLYPVTASAYGIDDIANLDAMSVGRYFAVIWRFICPDCLDRVHGHGHTLYDSKFVDLLNVKYLLTIYPLPGRWRTVNQMTPTLLERCQVMTPQTGVVSVDEKWTVQGDTQAVLFQHPPSRLDCPLKVPDRLTMLTFGVGMHPTLWQTGEIEGDGVLFEVYVTNSHGRHNVFSKYIDPKNNPADRKWHDAYVDLTSYRGQDVTLGFVTSPGPEQDDSYDWAGWGDLALAKASKPFAQLPELGWTPWLSRSGGPDSYEEKWELVYDREIKVYRNRQAFPRAFIVHNAEVVKDETAILDRMDSPGFDPRTTVVLEEDLPAEIVQALEVIPPKDWSMAHIVDYDPGHVSIEATLESPGFLVLSDTYYPGWKVSVDGQESKIYAANYLFRAVYLEGGKHSVEFVYDPLSFKVGSYLSIGTLLSVLVYVILTKVR